MSWIKSEALRFFCPGFADELIGREAAERLEAFGEIVCSDEVIEVSRYLFAAVVMVSLDGGLFDSPVHPLDRGIGPGMIRLGKSMLYAMAMADALEGTAAEACCPPLRFLGRSANWMPLSVSTGWMRTEQLVKCFQEG